MHHERAAAAVCGRGQIGEPLRIALPEGTPYAFARKYLATPPREPVADRALAHRVREQAQKTVHVLGADWAVRIDWIHERSSGKLLLLECDAAPLVGERSAFAQSLSAAGIGRGTQLRLLLAR